MSIVLELVQCAALRLPAIKVSLLMSGGDRTALYLDRLLNTQTELLRLCAPVAHHATQTWLAQPTRPM